MILEEDILCIIILIKHQVFCRYKSKIKNNNNNCNQIVLLFQIKKNNILILKVNLIINKNIKIIIINK